MAGEFENLILRDVVGSRPAAGVPGRLFFDTTNGKLQRDNGATWEDVESTVAAGAVATDAIWDAKGDLAGGTGANTAAKLTVGADGTHLEAASGETTGLKWVAGGRVFISELTPAGGATASFTSIPGTYTKLVIEFAARSSQAALNVNTNVSFNTDTTDANYRRTLFTHYAPNTSATYSGADRFLLAIAAANAPANNFTIGKIEIVQYANTGFYKTATADMSWDQGTTLFLLHQIASVKWTNTAAITQIDIALSAGNYAAGSVFRMYGEY